MDDVTKTTLDVPSSHRLHDHSLSAINMPPGSPPPSSSSSSTSSPSSSLPLLTEEGRTSYHDLFDFSSKQPQGHQLKAPTPTVSSSTATRSSGSSLLPLSLSLRISFLGARHHLLRPSCFSLSRFPLFHFVTSCTLPFVHLPPLFFSSCCC